MASHTKRPLNFVINLFFLLFMTLTNINIGTLFDQFGFLCVILFVVFSSAQLFHRFLPEYELFLNEFYFSQIFTILSEDHFTLVWLLLFHKTGVIHHSCEGNINLKFHSIRNLSQSWYECKMFNGFEFCSNWTDSKLYFRSKVLL